MPRTNWKKFRPNTLQDAMEGCTQYALQKHNRGIDRIAELMGKHSKYTLYKWLGNGRMPAVEIAAFEHACGCHFVSEFLGHQAHRLVVPIPTGKLSSEGINELQQVTSSAVSQILKFKAGSVTAEDAIGAIEAAMTGLAFHHQAVELHPQPELELA